MLTLQKIQEARDQIDAAHLSNSERIQLYKQLADTPRYRNQRDNTKNPESTCNLTAMAMAFEGLGMDLGDTSNVQREENLYRDFYTSSRRRTDEKDRANFARQLGLTTTHIQTPDFDDSTATKKWFKTHVLPQLEQGAQATMGIRSGEFRHVVRQWVDSGGLVIDDPYGKAVGNDGAFGYSEKNPTTRDTQGDQAGSGDNRTLDWETVAKICSDRYVQLYDK